MATAISTSSASLAHRTNQSVLLALTTKYLRPATQFQTKGFYLRKNNMLNICSVMMKRTEDFVNLKEDDKVPNVDDVHHIKKQVTLAVPRAEERLARKKSERYAYLVAAILSSVGITSMAAMSVYYRFFWQMEGGEFPFLEMLGTFVLSVGAAIGMEFWAKWAHRALWHDSLWHMHESHHRPRDGPFELNDVFAIINAVPAIALLSYGCFNKGLVPGLCFGAGLGITLFGMAYMFVHDGLVHRRFPVGPVANVPFLRRVAAAHQIHHSEKFDGIPYGLFLGPKEIEEVGGIEELDREDQRRLKMSRMS